MAILFINLSDSRCGSCDKHCTPVEVGHDTVIGYGPWQAGCTEEWTAVSSDYSGMDKHFLSGMGGLYPHLDGLPVLRYDGTRVGFFGQDKVVNSQEYFK